MTAPLTMSFDVACSVEHAFTVWTTGIGAWWPRDHSVTGRADLDVVLEGAVGGRIFERTPDGDEHDWGQVTVWQPPTELGYVWHLARDRVDATEVAIRFVPQGPTTRVEIEHRGWDLVSDPTTWRERNRIGWSSLLPHYLDAISEGAST